MTSRDIKTVLARVQTWPKGAQEEAIKALREIDGLFHWPRDKTGDRALARRGGSRTGCVSKRCKGAPGHLMSVCRSNLRSRRMNSLIDCPVACKHASWRSWNSTRRNPT